MDLTVSRTFPPETGEDSLLTNEISQNTQSQSSRREAESATQQLNTEISHLEVHAEVHEKHLELQKKFIECVIDVANKMIIDVLDPQCDVKTRSYAIEKL